MRRWIGLPRNGASLAGSRRPTSLPHTVAITASVQTIACPSRFRCTLFKGPAFPTLPVCKFGIRGFDLFRTYFTDVANRGWQSNRPC